MNFQSLKLVGLNIVSCVLLFGCDGSQKIEISDNAVTQKVVTETVVEKVAERPEVEVTIKDFKLGMSVEDVKNVISKVGLKYDDYGVILQNACSSNSASPMVKPMIEGGMSSIEPHFYDQACQLAQYDLIGSTSEVNIVLHDNKLVWAHFYTTGRNLIGSNQTLIEALIAKYGQPEKYKYRDMFGTETGMKWEIDDNQIMLKPSSLTLESKLGREEFIRRDKALKTQKGSVL